MPKRHRPTADIGFHVKPKLDWRLNYSAAWGRWAGGHLPEVQSLLPKSGL